MSASSSEDSPGVRIQSLERGLRILDVVARSTDGIALGELARRMGLGKTTVHNLVRTLVSTGHLVRRRDPVRYALGPEVFALAGHGRRDALHERAKPVLLALAREFPGSAALIAESAGDGAVRVVLRASDETPGGIERPLDRFSIPYVNTTSQVFLAFWNEEERRAFDRRHPFHETAAHLWPSEEAFEEHLRRIRSEGVAVAEHPSKKSFSVAVPVFSERGEILATLGLAYRSGEKVTAAVKRRLVARVREAVRDLAGG
jgi:Transcriptional regulator